MTDLRLAWRVVAVYVLTGFTWILLSDWLSFASADIKDAHGFQTAKGLAYVLATAGLLYWVIRRDTRLLRESEARFRSMVEGSPDAVFVQTQGRIAYVNSAALKLLGAAAAEALIGREVLDIIHPVSQDKVRQRIAQVTHDKVPVMAQEETFLRLDGTTVICEVSAVPIRYYGKEGSVVFVRDATERAHAQERQLYDQKMETIRQLSGGLAHDFNNLLQVINGYTELACEALPSDTTGRSYLEQVRQSGQRASELVVQLLTFCSHQSAPAERFDLDAISAGTMGVLQHVTGKDFDLTAGTQEPLASAPASPVPVRANREAGGKVVLIAEDEESVRRLTSRILKRAGYTVLEACDGAEAVALFKSHQGTIAAVILDIVMPHMGGFEAYDRIRELDDHVPVLFASGFSGFTSPDHVTLTDGVNLLQKPYPSRVLLSAVQRVTETEGVPA